MQLGTYLHHDHKRRRKRNRPLTITQDQRFRHTYILGKTGTGKSTLLKKMFLQDVRAGRGCAYFDPYGEDADDLLYYISDGRISDIIYFRPSDKQFPIGFNVLEKVPKDHRPLVASSVVEAFYHLWKDNWGPQLEQILYNAVAALLDTPNATLLGVHFILTSQQYRQYVIGHIQDPVIRGFWQKDFKNLIKGKSHDPTLSTLNKVSQFITDPATRNIIAQPNGISIREVMDGKQVFVANLGDIGAKQARLVGTLLTVKFHQEAMRRRRLVPFHIYYDEFQMFGSTAFLEMLSGIRKYRVSLTLAHQYMHQLERIDPTLPSAILGNVGTILAMQVSTKDAETLAAEFDIGSVSEFSQLLPRKAWLSNPKMKIDMRGISYKPVKAVHDQVIHASRKRARKRKEVEAEIAEFIESAYNR